MAHTEDHQQSYHRLQGDTAASGSAHHLLGLRDDPPLPEEFPEFPEQQPRRWWPVLYACVPCLGSCRGMASRAAIGWLTPTVWKAFRGELDEDSAFVNESQSSLTDSLRLWQLMRGPGGSGATLGRSAWHFSRGRLLTACLLGIIGAFGSVAGPALLLSGLIRALEVQRAHDYTPLVAWTAAITACELLTCLMHAATSSLAGREAGRLRAAIQGLLYRKLLRLNGCCELLPYQAETLLQTGVTPIWTLCRRATHLVTAPLLLVLSVSAACVLVGESAILAACIYVLALMLQTGAGVLSARLRARARSLFSRWRAQRTYELLSLARHAKTFLLESALIRRIKELRRNEAVTLRLAAMVDTLCRALLPAAVPAAAVGLGLHSALAPGGADTLTSSQVFPVLALMLVQLETALRTWGQAVRALFDARASLGQLRSVLLMEESKPHQDQPIDRLVAVSFNNASFSWAPSTASQATLFQPSEVQFSSPQSQSEPLNARQATLPHSSGVLSGIHIVVNKGQLVGVCGRPGSGKSALLLAALGQLRLTAGQLHRDPSTAYVASGADPAGGLLPGSLRDNVTMRGTLNSQRYYRALHSSRLERDVQALPTGDDTLVDSTRMSPAQLQRLALARALYADKEVYFLDDPVSALDSISADHVFESAVLGYLKGKTVILATNREQHLRHCDEVYVLREGQVVERGKPQELAESGREYSQVIDSNNKEEQWWMPPTSYEMTRGSERSRDDDEDMSGTGVYSELSCMAWECGAGMGRLSTLAAPLVLHALLHAGLALCFWLAVEHPEKPPLLLALFLLAASGLVALAFLRCFLLLQSLLRLSRRLHDSWLERVGCASIEYLQTAAPLLRDALVNHTWLLDSGLPRGLAGVVTWSSLVVLEVALLGVSASWGAAPILAVLLPGSILLTYIACVAGTRLWQRERACRQITRRLVGASASLWSRATILALGREDDLVAAFSRLCDQGASGLVHSEAVAAWLAVRLRMATALAGMVALLVQTWFPGTASALGMTAVLLTLVATHLPRAAVAALRTRSHLVAALEARDLVHRAEVEDEDLTQETSEDAVLLLPEGLENVLALRDVWRPPELRALTARLVGGECLGVLGPPSAVLASALLRFMRPSAGCILLGGSDIQILSLPTLRSAVVTVPAQPALFKGTLRWNLDPYGLWSDAQLWEALERTGSGLRETVARQERKLLTPVGGATPCPAGLGPEEVQLLCLSRALLRGSARVVVIEAPAGPRVLAAARKLFPQCSVLVAGRSISDVTQCGNVLQLAA